MGERQGHSRKRGLGVQTYIARNGTEATYFKQSVLLKCMA